MAGQIRNLISVALLAALAAVSAGGPSSAHAGALSVEDFFRKPQFLGAVLSPSGRYLAVSVPNGEQRALAIIDLETRAPTGKLAAFAGDVLGVLWQTDERLIVNIGDLQRVAGETPRQSGVIAIDRDGNHPRELWLPSAFTHNSVWGTVLRVIPGTNEVLLQAHARSPRSLDLYRYDTATGAKTLLSFDSPGNVTDWVVDFEGVPRALIATSMETDTSVWYVRKRGSDAWIKVEQTKSYRMDSVPWQFDPEGRILYVSVFRGADRAAVREYDVEMGGWGKTIISHPERDIEPRNATFIADYRERKLLGLRYADDRPSAVWFDGEWAAIQKSVDAALPDTVNVIQGSRDAKRWIVVARSDRNPGDVYLLDGKTMKMEKLFSYRSWISPQDMAPTRWIHYSARDGLSIPALLTVPPGAKGKPAPLVVRIHGGPYVQATAWGYDAEVQFVSSRGYAVLEPEFRGTHGFGWKHLYSGYPEMG